MDLIYTDSQKKDLGQFLKFEMDFEQSVIGEYNTFEIKTDKRLELGAFIYSNGTEYGGRVESLKHDTTSEVLTYGGMTWRGLLNNYIISPNVGQDYYIASGDLNDIIAHLIIRADLGSLFNVSEDSTLSITNYKFDRYCTLYEGIIKMLNRNGHRLNISVVDGVATLSAVPITILANEQEISNDMFDFTFEQQRFTANHMIGLGSGNLKDRLVVHKYIDAEGNISDHQYYFGSDEVTAVYDYPNAESLEDLEIGTATELEDLAIDNKLEMTANNIVAEIGDVVSAYDYLLDITIEQYVVGKVTTIADDMVQYQYEIGEKVL